MSSPAGASGLTTLGRLLALVIQEHWAGKAALKPLAVLNPLVIGRCKISAQDLTGQDKMSQFIIVSHKV